MFQNCDERAMEAYGSDKKALKKLLCLIVVFFFFKEEGHYRKTEINV
jgi:hypothetical protein